MENVEFETGPDRAALSERSSLARRLRWRLEVAEDDGFSKDKDSFNRLIAVLKEMEVLFATVVPDEMVARERARPNSRLHVSLESGVKGAFGYFLALLDQYRLKHDGAPPDRIERLLDGDTPEIPPLDLPDHASSAVPREVRRVRGDSLKDYLKDSGRWLYIADPRSSHFGRIIIDCSHKRMTGEVWHDVRTP